MVFLEGPMKRGDIGIAEQVCDLGDREMSVRQILASQTHANLGLNGAKRRVGFLQAAPQRSRADSELFSNGVEVV